jgi:hypothetical protein
MGIKNQRLIDEIKRAIRITEDGRSNSEINILKKVNQRTGAPIAKLKKLFDEYTTIYWSVEDLEDDSTVIYTSRLTLDFSYDDSTGEII